MLNTSSKIPDYRDEDQSHGPENRCPWGGIGGVVFPSKRSYVHLCPLGVVAMLIFRVRVTYAEASTAKHDGTAEDPSLPPSNAAAEIGRCPIYASHC